MIGKLLRLGRAPDVSNLPSTLALVLGVFLALRPGAAHAASPDGGRQTGERTEKAEAKNETKSEAAEAWDAVKDTTNRALLEAFIKRYRSTFFANLAKARLDEIKVSAGKPAPGDRRERAILYEEDVADPAGRQFTGSVTWHTEPVKADGKPKELAVRADVDIPLRGLRMRMSFKRNLDSSLPASHTIGLTLAMPARFTAGGIVNVPGILTKSDLQAKGVPLATLPVKITNGSFLLGLESANRERNLAGLVERPWLDIPIVYANQHRAILAIDKGESGERIFKTVLASWGQYPQAAEPAAMIPERNSGNNGATNDAAGTSAR